MLRRSIRFGTVRLSLERADGDLTSEQEKQVGFIRKGADTLLELVNDLLDLAKIEAGKVEVQPVDFEVANFFSALRGMLRPLLLSRSVRLVFEEPGGIPQLYIPMKANYRRSCAILFPTL